MGDESDALNDACCEYDDEDNCFGSSRHISDSLSRNFHEPVRRNFLSSRKKKKKTAAAVQSILAVPQGKTAMKCHCGQVYLARNADLSRGWALSCSKSCAGVRREYGKPAATRI